MPLKRVDKGFNFEEKRKEKAYQRGIMLQSGELWTQKTVKFVVLNGFLENLV